MILYSTGFSQRHSRPTAEGVYHAYVFLYFIQIQDMFKKSLNRPDQGRTYEIYTLSFELRFKDSGRLGLISTFLLLKVTEPQFAGRTTGLAELPHPARESNIIIP